MTSTEKLLKFESLVNSYLKLPFSDWDNFRPLEPYLEKLERGDTDEASAFRDACEKLFGWIGLNNSKEANVAAIKETYVLNEEIASLPSASGFGHLLATLTSNTESVIYIKGSRGSGKTAAINYFFTINAAHLECNGFTYFRCDVRKLQEVDNFIAARNVSLNEGLKDEYSTSGVTLEEYIDAHNIYVALMHSRDDIWLTPFKVCHEPDDAERFGKFDLYLEERSYKEEKTLWRGIVQAFLAQSTLESSGKNWERSPEMARFLAHIIMTFLRPSNASTNLVSNFHSLLQGQSGYKGTLLTIDGSDNFSRIEPATRSYYNNLIKQLKIFLPTDKSSRRYHSVILAFRPETMHEFLMELVAGPKATASNTFTINAVPVPEIMRRKHFAATGDNPLKHFNFVRDVQNNIFQKFLLEFEAFAASYIAVMSNEVKRNLPSQLTGSTLTDASLILNVLFQNNIRSMQRNIIGCYLHCYRAFEIERAHAYLTSLPVWCREKMWPIKEGSVLVGEFVIVDDGKYASPSRRGRWCPPLFSYRKEPDDGHEWHGLGLYRVLQLVNYRKSATENEAVNWIGKLGYSKDDVLWSFNRALMYGLIEVDEKLVAPRSIPFRLTNKGAYLIESIFLNSSLVYYQGAANLYPLCIHDRENGVFLHDETLYVDRAFFQAVLSVGIAIFRCIHFAHVKEISKLPNEHNAATLRLCFKEPNVDRCMRGWVAMFSVLLKRLPKNHLETDYFRSGLLTSLTRDVPV